MQQLIQLIECPDSRPFSCPYVQTCPALLPSPSTCGHRTSTCRPSHCGLSPLLATAALHLQGQSNLLAMALGVRPFLSSLLLLSTCTATCPESGTAPCSSSLLPCTAQNFGAGPTLNHFHVPAPPPFLHSVRCPCGAGQDCAASAGGWLWPREQWRQQILCDSLSEYEGRDWSLRGT